MVKLCKGVCNFPRVCNSDPNKVFCSTCEKLYHKKKAPKWKCVCCGTPVRLYLKRKNF